MQVRHFIQSISLPLTIETWSISRSADCYDDYIGPKLSFRLFSFKITGLARGKIPGSVNVVSERNVRLRIIVKIYKKSIRVTSLNWELIKIIYKIEGPIIKNQVIREPHQPFGKTIKPPQTTLNFPIYYPL